MQIVRVFTYFLLSMSLVAPLTSAAMGLKYSHLKDNTNSAQELGIIDQSTGVLSGKYIYPNEFRSYLYEPVLRDKKDVLISIGTFRGLFDAVIGDFDRIFLLDFDEQATRFNRANLNLIESLAKTWIPTDIQRYLYLCILLQKYVAIDLLSTLAHLNITEDKKLDLLFTYILGGKILINQLEPLGIHTQAHQLSKVSDDSISLISNPLSRMKAMHTIPDQIAIAPWSSNSNWEKIQKLVIEKRIIPVTGNIYNPDTFQEIGRYLLKTHQAVSVLDLSNVLDHLFYFEDSETKMKNRIDRLKASLNQLPQKNLEVLFTAYNDYSKFDVAFREFRKNKGVLIPSRNRFLYFSMPIHAFQAHVLEQHDLKEYLNALWTFYNQRTPSDSTDDQEGYDQTLIRLLN